MSELDDLLGARSRRRAGCWICDEPPVAAVTVQIARMNGEKREGTKNKQRSFCERHAIERFKELERYLEQKA